MIQTVLCVASGLICSLLVILTIRKASFDDGPHWAVVVLILLVGCGTAWTTSRCVQKIWGATF